MDILSSISNDRGYKFIISRFMKRYDDCKILEWF